MNLSIWCILMVALLISVNAKPPDQETKNNDGEKSDTKKQHKREPKYEMREVILYLTPSQIKALEAGQGLINQQQSQQQLQPEITHHSVYLHNQQLHANVQSQQQILPEENPHNRHNLQYEGQNIEDQVHNIESNERQRLQLEQYIQNEAAQQLNDQRVNVHQDNQPQLHSPNPLNNEDIAHTSQHQLINQAPQNPALFHQSSSQYPQSYAYLYFYPRGGQQNIENLHPDYSQSRAVPNRPSESSFLPQEHENTVLRPEHQFKLVPYEYNADKIAEALNIYNQPLTQSLVAQQLGNYELNGRVKEFHELPAHEEEVQQHNHQYHGSQLEQHLSQQINEELPNPLPLQGNLNIEENSQHLKQHLNTEQLVKDQKDTQSNLDQLKHLLESQKSEDSIDPKQQQALQLKAHLQHQEKLEAQKIETLKLDAHLQAQELEAEINKAKELKIKHEAHNHEVDASLQHSSLKLFNANIDGHMDTILSPLLQHQNVQESLKNQQLTQNEPKLEGGFKPLVYSPKDDTEKYAKEVSKILHEFHIEKQAALAKATAIAQEPPVVVHQEEQIIRKSAPQVKQVVDRSPYYVPVPQPYPVPLHIINPIPVPIVKIQKVEVEKPVPIEVEKHVPVPVYKNVMVNVEKPYIVEKHVPVEITKKIPVKVTVKVPRKFTIIRHVWGH